MQIICMELWVTPAQDGLPTVCQMCDMSKILYVNLYCMVNVPVNSLRNKYIDNKTT